MKKTTKVNRLIYDLSKNFYGKQRFKLKVDAINELEELGQRKSDLIPEICLNFENQRELDDYRKAAIDFLILNFIITRELFSIYQFILLGMDVFRSMEDNAELLIDLIYQMERFSDILSAIYEIQEEYGYKLILKSNQKKINDCKKELQTFKKLILNRLKSRKINPPKINKPMEDGARFIKNLIRNFHIDALLGE